MNTGESSSESVNTINEDAFNYPPSYLHSLPYEILLKIFSYLEPHFLSRTVTRVCKRFTHILNDELFWKRRFIQIVNTRNDLPIILTHPVNVGLSDRRWWSGRDLLWRNLTVQFSIMEEKWVHQKSFITTNTKERLHYAPIDTLKILGNGSLIVSGGRDRAINVSKIDQENLSVEKIDCAIRGHDGWIWDFDSCTPDQFFSCGWDNQVNYWNLSTGLERLCTFNCRKPVMAISVTPGLLAAGLHIPRIVLIDPRFTCVHEIEPNYSTFNYHRHTITDVLLVPDKNLLLSISEDKSLCYFDLRQLRPFKTVYATDENSFPRRMSLYRNMLYIGDAKGKIYFHSIDCDTPKIPPVDLGRNRLITAVQPYKTCVVAGSTAGFVKIFYPSSPPIYLWEQSFNGEVTCIDQYGDLLAVTSASSTLSLFRPPSI